MCRGWSMRALLSGIACLLCLGLLISASMVGGVANAAPPVTTAAVVASSRGKPVGGRSLDPFYASERRVPNGPDPIHNRRAGNFGRPPVRA